MTERKYEPGQTWVSQKNGESLTILNRSNHMFTTVKQRTMNEEVYHQKLSAWMKRHEAKLKE